MAEPHEVVNGLSTQEADDVLRACCASGRWVERMLSYRPFASQTELLCAADSVWSALSRTDYLEAFAGHPAIGENLGAQQQGSAAANWSTDEQASVAEASPTVLSRLRAANLSYHERFGYIFIVCATGKSASEMLALLEARLDNAADVELQLAASEQAKITRLRLEKLKR